MSAYAVAHLRDAQFHPEIAEYIDRIQETLDPYSGRFLVHGGEKEVKEGTWPGNIVVVVFPGLDEARAWYDSPAYREILPLRTRHIEGDIILVQGVPDDYDPSTTAAKMRQAQGA